MQEIGHAALAIIPSFDGLQGNLERGSSKAMLAAGDKGGAQFGDAAGKSAGSRFSGHVKNAAKAAALGLAAAGAVAIKFAGDSLEEAREAQKVGAQTAAVIKSTGGAAKVAEKDVGKLTGRLSDMAGIDDELIQNGANVLLTFTKIRNEVGKGSNIFDRATKSALNMSVALGQDLKGASVLVGKALNDPIKGVTALGRAGVQLTEIQKAQIKALVEGGDVNAAVATGLVSDAQSFNDLLKAQDGDLGKVVDTLTRKLTPAQQKTYDMYAEGGHTLEAQKRILQELDTQFKGSAKAQATEADKLGVAFGNLKEEVGTALIPVMDDLAVFLRKKGIPAARDFFGWIQDDGIPAVKDFYEQTKPVIRGVKDLVDAFNDLPGAGKIASVGGALAGGLVVKHKLSGIFDRGGIANPMFVTVTNPGLGGAPDGGTGGKAGAARLALGAVSSIAIAAAGTIGIEKLSEKLAPDTTKNGNWGTPNSSVGLGTTNGDKGGIIDMTGFLGVDDKDGVKKKSAEIEGLISKVDIFRNSLDLAGSTKVNPHLSVPGLKEARAGLSDFIDKQIEARRPVLPYINTTSIERAIALLGTMNAGIARNAQIERGADGGVNYQHGGGATANPRAGVNFNGPIHVTAHDYNDLTRQLERKTQQVGLGGFR